MEDVRFTEQSLVAGLVLAPERISEVAGWLSAADFWSPAAGAIYERLVWLSSAGRVDAAALLADLRAEGELRRDGYPLSALMRWFDDTPAPGHPVAYGRLIVEAAAGRQVVAAGTRLVQVAARGGPVRCLAAATAQRALLGATRRRLDALPGVGVDRAPDRPAGQHMRDVQADAPGEASHAELVTVGSLLMAPHLTPRVGRWLRAEDFADAGCGELFALIGEMHAAGRPVDLVTVSAQLHARGRLGRAVPSALLTGAVGSVLVATSVGFYGRQVLADAVVRRTSDVGRQLVRGDRQGEPVVAAIGQLNSLEPVGRRLRMAMAATTQPRRTEVTSPGRLRASVLDASRR
jgi:replicative DNA helicase